MRIKKKNPKGGRRGFTIEIIAEALRKNMGYVSDTARAIGISVPALCERIEKSEELQKVMRETEIHFCDIAIKKLIKNIENGEQKAIEYYLNKKGLFYRFAESAEATSEKPMPVQPIEIFINHEKK